MDSSQKTEVFRSKFYGRQDVYGKQWEMVDKADGKIKRGFAPVCGSINDPGCHIRLKDGISCAKCEKKKWAPVTDESTLKHIIGEQAQLVYMLLQDGTIRFGAMDFDLKEGKEAEGYGFDEVSKVSSLLSDWGVKHHIARSTGSGYHLYIFFDKPYSASRFRSFLFEVYSRVGFMHYIQQGIKPLPEMFPKQSYVASDGIGNGIKPPMIEPRFEKCRNGWVDRFNNFIGQDFPPEARIEAQWEYLATAEYQSCEEFDRIIEEQSIEIPEETPTSSTGSSTERVYDRASNAGSGKWAQPLAGSIEKVMEGCAAFRRVRDKALEGQKLSHDEGFSLYHMSMHAMDGLDWFDKNVKDWGGTDSDKRQLEHSIDHNYSPWTCKKLQERGVCSLGTQCFEKRPPKEIVDGMEVIRDDLPKEKWPEPSPIRYAHGRGEDYMLKLKAEVSEVKKSKSESVKLEKLKALTLRAQVFDDGQFKDFKAFVREEKILKRNEISKIFNEASEEYEEDVKKKIKSLPNSSQMDDQLYVKEDYGYSLLKPVKNGKPNRIRLCSIDIIVKEIKTYHEEGLQKETRICGTVRAPGEERPFDLDMEDWSDVGLFNKYFTSILTTKFSPLRVNVEYIRQAALSFSEATGVEKKAHLLTQGYYDGSYLMPSCVVDSHGVRPNTSQQVDLTNKRTAGMDFKILSDEDFRNVLLHVKSDFLTTWPEAWTYVGLSHTLAAGVMEPMGWIKRHTLFYEGLTGGGKSELTHALQFFWGRFDSLNNFMSSPKGVRELGYQFKDACIVVDDYKGLTKEQTASVREAILHAYDRATDVKLNRDGTARAGRLIRGLFVMSGEEFITHDAAVIARTILVETGKHRTVETQEKYRRVMATRKDYCGITPRFISWFLGQDLAAIESTRYGHYIQLKEGHADAQNIDRVTNSLATNYVTWCMFTKFMVEHNVASPTEKDVMDARHWTFMLKLRHSMLKRCAEEQASEAFLRILAQMLVSGEVAIEGLPGCITEHKPVIGYVPKNTIGLLYLFPDAVMEKVKGYSRNNPITGTATSIGRQLEDQGILITKDRGHLTKSTTYGNRKLRVWSIKSSALGVDLGEYQGETEEEEKPKNNVVDIRSASKDDGRRMF